MQPATQTFIDDILSWTNSNKLRLNTDKTEVMAVGTLSRLRLVKSDSACTIQSTASVAPLSSSSATRSQPVCLRNKSYIYRLQKVQNSAARPVLKKRKRDHTTPLLNELHWLAVKFRCGYKTATLANRHFDGTLTSASRWSNPIPFGFTRDIPNITHPPILTGEAFDNS